MELLPIIANVVGIVAVALFLLSYLQKSRARIIGLNVTSRCLYILQYILLGAFSGAVLDVAGAASSVLAQKKNASFIKRHVKLFVLGIDLIIVLLGLLTVLLGARASGTELLSAQSALGLLPIAGVLLHTSAFWMDDEKKIRRVSLLGSPFWFAYNLLSGAFGSSVGDLLSMVSILIAMLRYDRKPPTESQAEDGH